MIYRVQANDDLAHEIENARKARNYLVHHFYRDRADLFTTPEGCKRPESILTSINDDLDAARQSLEDWRDKHLGYTRPEDTWDRINDDVGRWESENQQMLDALLGKSQRRG